MFAQPIPARLQRGMRGRQNDSQKPRSMCIIYKSILLYKIVRIYIKRMLVHFVLGVSLWQLYLPGKIHYSNHNMSDAQTKG
jgi:hypothetical protein